MVDGTRWWVFWQQHRLHLFYAAVGLLLFATGWQLGRTTSPYYASHPIVFEESACEQCASAGGSAESLSALQQAGVAARESSSSETAAASASPAVQPQVAAAQDEAPTGKFVGSKNSDLFHDPSCSSAARIKPENQVWFSSVEEATAAGYEPSQCTQEKIGNTP